MHPSVSSSSMVDATMGSAEEERLQQAPLVAEEGADFQAAISSEPATAAAPAQKPKQIHTRPAAATNGHAVGGNNGMVGGAQHATGNLQAPTFHASQMPARSASQQPLPPTHAHPPSHAPSAAASAVAAAPRAASAAASPSASSSPLSGHGPALPYPHTAPLFASKLVYLHPSQSPSQRDGLTAQDEFILRAHTCMFMSAMGQRLKLGQLALATASVFVQVFFTHYSFRAFDRLEIACTCLFLAGKVEERRVRVDHVLNAYYLDKEVEEKKWSDAANEGGFAPRPRPLMDSPVWDALRLRVYEYESLLMDAIEYNFELLHPYSYLRKFLEKYIYSSVYCKETEKFVARHLSGTGGLAQIAWNFINDSLRTSLCLQYAPSIICVVAIRLAMRHLILVTKALDAEPVRKLQPGQQPPSGKAKPWFEELFGVDKRTDKVISGEIMKVLELQKDPQHDLRVLEAHRKAQVRSVIPKPCARSTQELLRQQRAQQAQQAQQGARAAAQAGATTTNAAPAAAPGAPPPHADRKRARSPAAKHDGSTGRRDALDVSRSSQAPGHGRHHRSPRTHVPPYSPLPCPPSPFLDAGQPRKWLPDLTRDKRDDRGERGSPHKQGQQQRQRDGDKDRERGRAHERDPRSQGSSHAPRSQDRSAPGSGSGSKSSPHGRPRLRERHSSGRRSHSREDAGQRMTDVPAAGAVASGPVPAQPSSSPLEEGEIRVADIQPQLSTIREEGSSEPPKDAALLMDGSLGGRLVLSPRALMSASSSLTKSCSSYTLSSMVAPSTSHPRLHVSASMSNLSASAAAAAAGGDILADIMTSAAPSPSDAATLGLGGASSAAIEDDMMRGIGIGRNDLQGDVEEREEDGERHAKRMRVTSKQTSPYESGHSRVGSAGFEPGAQPDVSSHALPAVSVPVPASAPATTLAAPLVPSASAPAVTSDVVASQPGASADTAMTDGDGVEGQSHATHESKHPTMSTDDVPAAAPVAAQPQTDAATDVAASAGVEGVPASKDPIPDSNGHTATAAASDQQPAPMLTAS